MDMESTTIVRVARAGIVLLALLTTTIALYSFAIIARYELGIKAVLRNAVIYTLLYFPRNLVTVAMIAAGILAYNFLTPIIPLVVTLVPPIVIWHFSKTCVKAFRASENRAEDDE